MLNLHRLMLSAAFGLVAVNELRKAPALPVLTLRRAVPKEVLAG